jgi:hypothetical protein
VIVFLWEYFDAHLIGFALEIEDFVVLKNTPALVGQEKKKRERKKRRYSNHLRFQFLIT